MNWIHAVEAPGWTKAWCVWWTVGVPQSLGRKESMIGAGEACGKL